MKSSVNRKQTTKRKPSSTRKPSLSDLPPEQKYLSKDQFREIAQIGTRTATRLISSGLVPAIDTHMKTSRYLIAKTDVEEYLRNRESDPGKYGYPYRTSGNASVYNRVASDKMKKIAEAEWKNERDILTVSEVSHLIGYRTQTIYRWRIRFGIKSIEISGKLFIPKNSLLQFISSPMFHEVQRKSKEHFDLIRKAYGIGTD